MVTQNSFIQLCTLKPLPLPRPMRKNVVLQSSRYERSTVTQDVLLCSGKNTPFKSSNKFGVLTRNNCADFSFNTCSTLKMYAWFMSYSKIAPIIELQLGTMVDSMKQIFLLKPEVLTRNRNGFMAKKRKWHLKAGSTVCNGEDL